MRSEMSVRGEKYTKKQMTKFVTELIIGIFAKDSASPQGLVGDILDSMKAVA